MPSTKVTMPKKEAVIFAMELSKNSAEAANYLASRIDEIIVKAKIGPEANELKQQIHVFAKHVAYQLGGNKDAWNGSVTESSRYANLHEHIAQEASLLFENMQNKQIEQAEIMFHFAMNDKGEFLRGYSEASPHAHEEKHFENERLEGGGTYAGA